MALGKRHSISTFITKFLWILFLVNHESILVICDDGLEDDSLKEALEAIERRQKDLELQENPENEYFGQPENIGYGFQKTLGFFDNAAAPASELGSFDSSPKSDDDLQNLLDFGDYVKDDYAGGFEKRKSNFRERSSRDYLISQRDTGEDIGGVEYLHMLKNLWQNYQKSHPDDHNLEDLTNEQVEEILNAFGDDEEYADPGYDSMEVIPLRNRKNYRVFDWFGDRKKRYPSFGEGIYGKRNRHAQNIDYQPPPENDFLYSLKYVNPEYNREAVENLREEGEVLGDEKDQDVMRIVHRPRPKERVYYGMEVDHPIVLGTVRYSSDDFSPLGRNEKRVLKYFKNHSGGLHLNTKRYPVKRSTSRVRKEVKNESEVSTTPEPEKKTITKKPAIVKKLNVTKPEVTKKVARSTKEVVPPSSGNSEIEEIFNPKAKKSIDWSQYFGLDKRGGENWLREDQLRRAESHLMVPKSKRYSLDTPFDTRRFSRKGYPFDLSSNIDKVENKIGDIEEKIIDDAVKYTGAHTGAAKEDLTQVKNKVIQRLEAAYSLEKMKNALEEFKNIIKPGRNAESLKKASTEAPRAEAGTSVPKESSSLEKPLSEKKSDPEAMKRVAIKKEGVGPEPSEGLEFLNDVYGRQYENEECPVLDKILHNCLRVEEMAGRYAELLIPLCSLQQICYFCGAEIGFSKMSMCDAMYIMEAQSICQGDSDCQVSARNSMLALQDLYEEGLTNANGGRLLSSSCLANPCIQKYFLNAPGAIYPLEVQK